MSSDLEFYRQMAEQQAVFADRARLAKQIADRNLALAEIRGYLREISSYVPAYGDGGGCLIHVAKLIDGLIPGSTTISSSDSGMTYPLWEKP